MRILNLGCGNKVCDHPDVINIDWSIELRLRRNPLMRSLVSKCIGGERKRRFDALPSNIMVHNLKRGIPFESNSVDMVYHSHLLEHLDRTVAEEFLQEIKRVLKPGGVQRIVVPDLAVIANSYLEHLKECEKNDQEARKHDEYIASLIEQSVRRDAYGSSQQKPVLRMLENLVLGDARQRGETHQWMYDRINLCNLLIRLGYRNPVIQSYDSSSVDTWALYELDLNDAGREYKPFSLYVEVNK